MRVSIRAAGPVTAAPPTSGLTATQRARRRSSASRIAATARIGPIERYGLLGAKRMPSAASSAARTPGAASASSAPSYSTRVHVVAMTPTDEPLLEREPPGGREDVRAQAIVGRRKDPRADARRALRRSAVISDSGVPSRSARVRTRWSPMSRSPSRNQSSPPKLAADSSAFQVSSARPQPRSASMSPPSV